MPVKIAYSGSHGTGKTTAVYKFAHQIKMGEPHPLIEEPYPNVGVLCEVARDCPFPVDKKATLESQVWMFTEHLNREIAMSHKYSVIILDRSIYDYIAYTKLISPATAHSMLLLVQNSKIPQYDEIRYMEINTELLKDDGTRSCDLEFQKIIDISLRDILKNLDTNLVFM